jgi:competence protein ComEC
MKHLVWLFIIVLICVRYWTTRPIYENGDIVKISGPVLSDPVNYPTSQYLKLNGLKIYLPKFPVIHYGDYVVIQGKVDDGELTSPKLINAYAEKTFGSTFRNKVIYFYQRTLPEPEAGLLAGIVLGSKGALDKDFYNRTKTTGTAHIVVASGTNIAFVVSFLMASATLFVKRRKAIYIVILGIILYLFLSGFDAPLIRASLMSLFIFLGEEVGRIVNKWKVYFFTVGAMLVFKPDWILDLGFLLSFAATGSIMLFEGKIRTFLKVVPGLIKESLSGTLAAEIGVAPILLLSFGQFNLLSPIINVLVLWTVPGVMIFGALGGVIGVIFEPMGKIFLYLAYPMLWWFTQVVWLFG